MNTLSQPLLPFNPLMVMEALKNRGAISLPLVPEEARLALLQEAMSMTFKQAATLAGKRNVPQNFSTAADFSGGSMLIRFPRQVATHITETFKALGSSPFSHPLTFNDAIVHRYAPSALGLGAHRDHRSNINIICLIILKGHGEFCLCDDGEGTNPQPLDSTPGNGIMMRAPGFMEEDISLDTIQPWHLVRNITHERYVLTLRHHRYPET